MNLDELSDRLESLESAHESHSELKALLGESLARLSSLRKQGKAYAAFGVEPLKVHLPVVLQANIARYKARSLWAEIESLAGLAAYNAATSKISKLCLMVEGAGKSKVLRSTSESNAIYAGSLADVKDAYRQSVKLCFKLRKGKRAMKDRCVIDHNAFVSWRTLWVGLKQVKRLLALKSAAVIHARLQDKHFASLSLWAKMQGISLSKFTNPNEQWEEVGRLNGRVYVIHNALADTPISKSEKAKEKIYYEHDLHPYADGDFTATQAYVHDETGARVIAPFPKRPVVAVKGSKRRVGIENMPKDSAPDTTGLQPMPTRQPAIMSEYEWKCEIMLRRGKFIDHAPTRFYIETLLVNRI